MVQRLNNISNGLKNRRKPEAPPLTSKRYYLRDIESLSHSYYRQAKSEIKLDKGISPNKTLHTFLLNRYDGLRIRFNVV